VTVNFLVINMSFKIHLLTGMGFDSNIYLIEDETIALVDAGTGRFFENLKEEIQGLSINLEDIDMLINTHCHFDHAGGDLDFVEASRCKVLIHEIEKSALEKGDEVISCAVMFGEKFRAVKVDRALKEDDLIELGELNLTILHTPGHTAGSISLYDPQRGILFSGDTVFSDGVGRTDLPTGDQRLLIESLRRLNTLKVEKLYPGHGVPKEKNGNQPIRNALNFFK